MAGYTNIYAQQKGVKNFKDTSSNEMKVFVGIHLLMGAINFPRVRMYWQMKYRISIIADAMTRNRFFQLRSNFHVINNDTIPLDNTDKFIKIRPLYNSIKKRCNELEIENNICVDEQMVPFKGTCSLKQYLRGKPSPWGIKIFLMCRESGIIYDLVLFQGANTKLDEMTKNNLGFGGAVVMKLTEHVEPQKHFLYFDNYFSSYNLFHALEKKRIYAVGTVRVNRFEKPPLLSDKEMAKLERGSSFEIRSSVPNSKVGLLKWFDNKAVAMGSNFVTSGIPNVVQRWNKKEKCYVEVDMPEIII